MVKKYKSGIDNHISEQKSHHEQHIKTSKHKQAREIERLKMMQKNYWGNSGNGKKIKLKGEEKDKHIEKLLDKKETIIIDVEESNECKKYERTNTLVSELTEEEKIKQKEEEDFKVIFKQFLDKCHNILRSNASISGEEALDDIINTFLIIYLDGKITDDDGIFNFGNLNKAYYRNPSEKKKVKEYLKCLSIKYLKDNVAELRHSDKLDDIKRIGYILTKHPTTKGIIKNDNFINCKNANTYVKFLKFVDDFVKEYNIYSYDDLVGLAYEHFVNDYKDGGGGNEGQYFTERPLMGMSFKMIDKEDIDDLDINNDSVIGDEFCGTIGYPINLKRYLNDKYNIEIQNKNIYGIEQNPRLARYAKLNALFSINTTENIKEADSFIEDVSPHLDFGVFNVPFGKDNVYETKKELYSKIVGLPDFNKIFKKGGPLAVMASQLAFFKIKKIGLCIIKDGEETSSDKHKVYRKFLCDNYVIKKIMKIPQGTFSSTGTATVCIYFIKKEGKSTENIQFLQLNKECSQLHEICKINLNDLKQNNYSWDPKAYLVDEKMKELMEKSKCEIKMLKDVSEIIYGNRNKENISDTETYPCLGGGEKVSKYTNKWNIPKDTIIIARSGSCGSISIFDVPCLLGSYAFFLKFKENINKISIKYIYYYLKNVEAEIKKLGKGGNQKNINRDELYDFPIHFPKIEIQTKCVEQLNDLSNQKEMINSMINDINKNIKLIMGLTMKKGNSKLVNIGECVNISKGKGITKKNRTGGDIPYYASNGHSGNSYMDKSNIDGNFILLAEDGTIGSIHYIDENTKIWVGDHVHILKDKNTNLYNLRYLYNYLKYNVNYEMITTGCSIPKLNKGNLLKINMYLPSLDNQNDILLEIDKKNNLINSLFSELKSIDNLMKEIMQSTYQ